MPQPWPCSPCFKPTVKSCSKYEGPIMSPHSHVDESEGKKGRSEVESALQKVAEVSPWL